MDMEAVLSRVPLRKFCNALAKTRYSKDVRDVTMRRRPLAIALILLVGSTLVAQPPSPQGSSPGENKYTEIALDLGDGIKLDLILIPAGSFVMGDDGDRDAKPAHTVAISASYYLGKYEVTQEQWKAVMGTAHAATTTSGRGCRSTRSSGGSAKSSAQAQRAVSR